MGEETTIELRLRRESCVVWAALSSDGATVAEGVVRGDHSLDDPELIRTIETKVLLASLGERVAQFRVRKEGVLWEDTPVIEEGRFCPEEGPDERAIELVCEHGKHVRWNWKGSAEGHYIFEVVEDEVKAALRYEPFGPDCPQCG